MATCNSTANNKMTIVARLIFTLLFVCLADGEYFLVETDYDKENGVMEDVVDEVEINDDKENGVMEDVVDEVERDDDKENGVMEDVINEVETDDNKENAVIEDVVDKGIDYVIDRGATIMW